MNLAVLLSKDIGYPDGLPGDWPVECRELKNSTILPSDGRPWRLMTVQQVKDLQATNQTAKDIWNSELETKENTQVLIDVEYERAIEQKIPHSMALDEQIKVIVVEKLDILSQEAEIKEDLR